MNNIRIGFFRELLTTQGNSIEHTIQSMKENKDAEQNKYSPSELSNYDNHPAELASDLYELEHNNAIRVHEEFLLSEITQAIKRIDNGFYGECAFCGANIGEERLEVIPYAKLCINCEEDKVADREIQRNKTPYFEQELPYEKLFTDLNDSEFEGIDYYNDLAKYGSSDGPQDMGMNRDMKGFYTNDIDNQGLVDKMDNISNEEYRRQLPD